MSDFNQKLDTILKKHKDLGEKLMKPEELGDDFAKISKEYSDLEEIVENINKFKASKKN